ncbi:MAG: AAA family ATPase, partial [Chloroflexi bacterium]|nr:AAA family ATPase [Chloroflexota bacterium]
MLTGIRSVLGRLQRKKPDDLEEALEDSTLSPEERGPPLLVLISTGAVLSFQLHSFTETESAAQFIQSRFPPGMKQGIFAFWAIQREPQQPPDAELRRTNDAVVMLRDPARPGVVELISCVDMASAQSLVRGEVREGLDLSLVMVYWAMPVAIETDENGIYRLSPSAPPPIVRRAPPAEVVTEEEPAAPPEADAEATVEAPVVEEAPPAEVATEEEPAAPQEADAEATIDAPVVEEAPPAEVVTEEEPAAPQEAEAEATIDAPVVEEAPPAEVVTEEEPAAPQAEEAVGATGPKVIIVDPNEAGRTELQKTLAPSSIAVVGRTDYGKEAIALARQSRPDVLIVAMEEPVARAVRMVESLADLLPQSPIVVYSSIKDFGNIRRAMLAGAKDYLVTPVSGEELVRSVHTVLAQEERRGQRLSGEAEGPETVGKVITVFGAKGGIGKTTIATNLAAAIAHGTRESVVLIDLDPRFGDVGILLDIPVERSIADLALPEEEVTKELIQDSLYVHSTGVKILAAPLRPTDWRDVNPRHIERVVTVLAQTYDYVILD